MSHEPSRRGDTPLGDARLTAAVEAIYEAALEPELWPSALQAIGTLMQARSATLLFTGDGERSRHPIVAFHNVDPENIGTYNREFQGRDPTVSHSLSLPVGAYVSSADICTDGEWRRTDLYHDLVARDGGFYLEGSTLIREPGSYAAVGMQRTFDVGPASPREREVFLLLVRHLRRALAIHRRIQTSAESAANLEAAVDRLSTGVVLLDGGGRVRHANGAARRLAAAGDGFRLTAAGVAAATSADHARLAALIASALAPVGLALGGGTTLRRPSGRAPYEVLVVPLRHPGTAAALFVGDPDERRPSRPDLLRALYGLTPAEARLAADLADGLTLEESAERSSTQVATARTHLKRIFAKTRTRRQSELVRLLLRGPSAVVDGSATLAPPD